MTDKYKGWYPDYIENEKENACEGGSRGKCTGGNEEAFL